MLYVIFICVNCHYLPLSLSFRAILFPLIFFLFIYLIFMCVFNSLPLPLPFTQSTYTLFELSVSFLFYIIYFFQSFIFIFLSLYFILFIHLLDFIYLFFGGGGGILLMCFVQLAYFIFMNSAILIWKLYNIQVHRKTKFCRNFSIFDHLYCLCFFLLTN